MRAISASGSAVEDRGASPARSSFSFISLSAPFVQSGALRAALHYKRELLQSIRRKVPKRLRNLLSQSSTELSPNWTVTTVPASTSVPPATDWVMA